MTIVQEYRYHTATEFTFCCLNTNHENQIRHQQNKDEIEEYREQGVLSSESSAKENITKLECYKKGWTEKFCIVYMPVSLCIGNLVLWLWLSLQGRVVSTSLSKWLYCDTLSKVCRHWMSLHSARYILISKLRGWVYSDFGMINDRP